jgi:hypothetical protein
MPHPDPASSPTSGPEADPESVYDTYLTIDIRPAIRAARPDQMRRILGDIGRYLCHHVRQDHRAIPALSPDRPQPGKVRQSGSGMRAGFQLYQHATQAVAGGFLHALGFDPARAAGEDSYLSTEVDPFLGKATTGRMRRTLLTFADHVQFVLDDSDTIASASTQADLPDHLWQLATGVSAAIHLHRHAVRALAAHVLYYAWDGLELGDTLRFRPVAEADFFAIHQN